MRTNPTEIIRRIWEIAISGDQNIDPALSEIQNLCEGYLKWIDGLGMKKKELPK